MPTLYELDNQMEQAIELGFVVDEETGEVLFDPTELDKLSEMFNAKVEACGIWLKNRIAFAEALREEERSLRKRRMQAEKQVENMKAYVLRSIVKMTDSKFETPKVKMSTRRCSCVVVDSEEMLPEDVVKKEIVTKVDKTELRKMLKEGDVPGAHLEESINLMVG